MYLSHKVTFHELSSYINISQKRLEKHPLDQFSHQKIFVLPPWQ